MGDGDEKGDMETRNIIEVTELEKEASAVLTNAKKLSEDVIQSVQNLKQAEHDCANAVSFLINLHTGAGLHACIRTSF